MNSRATLVHVDYILTTKHAVWGRLYTKQEAQLPQRDRATCYVSQFVLRFTSHGSRKGFKQQSHLQGHSRALAMVPFDRPHTISY